MMKLIDPQGLIKDIMKRKDINMGVKSLVCDVISYQPTAYDVDKAVAKLKKSAFVDEYASDIKVVDLDRAIEIAMKG